MVKASHGKSRIAIAIALSLLLSAQTRIERVHLVFSNEDLMKRDRDQYYGFVEQCGLKDKIFYRNSITDFKPEKKDMVVLDEGDEMALGDPEQFMQVMKGV